jgi:hypothetical protein
VIGINGQEDLAMRADEGGIVSEGENEEIGMGVSYFVEDELERGSKENGTQRIALLSASFTGNGISLPRVIEFEKARDDIVGLKMSPENIPAMPRLIGNIVGVMEGTASCEKVVNMLPAFSVECVAEIQVSEERARIARQMVK